MPIVMPTFRFRLVPFIATVLLVALGCSLSFWQMQRAEQKEAIEAKLAAREKLPAIDFPTTIDISQMEYTRVILKGEFVNDWPIYLDNRPMNGIAGIDVVMPFKLQGNSHYVLVARGWIPRNAQDRFAIKPFETPSGPIQIEGILKANSSHILQLGKSEPLRPKTLVQNVEVDAFIQASKLPTYPFIVEQTSNANDGLLRDWPRASIGSERHRGYAFQWLALAGMALLFFLVTGFKKK
jgi:cytochrome oxidase assembly protein ShyY1